MTELFRDLKMAVRVLLRTKSWTAIVLVSLALGIGANTALFTAVNGLLLQTLPVHEPERLIRFNWTGKNDMVRSSSDYGYSGPSNTEFSIRSTFSFPMFQQLRASNATLTDLAAGAPAGSMNVLLNGDAQLASSYQASGNYFKVLGAHALIGRTFDETDDTVTASPVAVISYPYWQKRFAGESSVVNKVVSMNGQMVTIVGVMPKEFIGHQKLGNDAPDITVPLAFDTVFSPPLPLPNQTAAIPRMAQPTYWWLQLIGRLKPGATIEQAKSNFTTVFENTAKAGMAEYQAGLTAEEKNLSFNRQRGTSVPQLLVKSAAHGYYEIDPNAKKSAGFLSVVVIIVLLIVCANVANLLLSRATTRHREISLRLSMGATRGRLVRQLLTESLLLSGLGGALGVLVGYWSRGLLPFGQTTPIDWRVFAFVAGISMLTGIVFGLMPALRATRVDLSSAMKESSRSVTGSRTILSRGLLVLQVGMSLVLIIGAGLFLRTLENLKSVDVGFDSTNLLMFNINPSVNRYDQDRSLALFKQAYDRLSTLPGVKSAAYTRTTLLSGSTSTSSMWREGDTNTKATVDEMYMMDVSPTFFATLGIPVQRGRAFTDHDDKSSPKVAILNEAAARLMFPNGDAVGHRLGGSLEKNTDFEIIGVVRDTKYASVRDPGPPTMYRAAFQSPVRSLSVILRTAGDPMAMTETVRTAMKDVDATLPIQRFTSQSEQISLRFAQERLFATAYTAFGALALVLACVGLFGLMSYNVARRTNEIGIRMALGAQRTTVVGMVMGESMLLVGLGVAIGLGSALAAGKYVKELATVLYGVDVRDVATIGGAVLLIAFVSALAGYLPARRASKVDPMVALHQQ